MKVLMWRVLPHLVNVVAVETEVAARQILGLHSSEVTEVAIAYDNSIKTKKDMGVHNHWDRLFEGHPSELM